MSDKINIANILTFSRIIFGIIFMLLFMLTKLTTISKINLIIIDIVSFFVFIIAIITDGLDGYFARKNDKVTDFGKHFDPLSDSIFFIIVFFSFFIIKLMPWYFLLLIILREGFMHIFLRPYIKSKGKSLPANIYGKIKTLFQSTFSIIIISCLTFKDIMIYFNFNKKLIDEGYIIFEIVAYIFFAIIVFLSIYSLIIYLIQFKNFKSKTS